MQSIDLRASTTVLTGVGPHWARLMWEEMRIATLGDLLLYFPYKHIDRSRIYRLSELTPDMPFVQLRGSILSFERFGQGKSSRLVAHFSDGGGVLDLVWFNGQRFIERSYHVGGEYIVFGRPRFFKGRFDILHPDIDPVESLHFEGIGLRPYYSVPEKVTRHGLNSHAIERLMASLLALIRTPLPEVLPPSILGSLKLMGRDQALRAMHFPKGSDELSAATERMKFEELFFIQLGILRYCRERNRRQAGCLMPRVGERFNDFYHNYLAFPLTGAQKRVIKEMQADMKSGHQMNRLLQGDVGSGKTLVALMTILLAIDNGYQACVMAPTEILAEQHLATFREMLGDMPVRVELLTGEVKGNRRKEVLESLAAGRVDILIGTHAVIEEQVRFARLGFVVIDEQHRFGVEQRSRLWTKTERPPHILVMTATPIPRTLAMTLYGDLDVSVIDELPPGRKPVMTVHQYDRHRADLYEGLRRQMRLGRQVYVVYPLIKGTKKVEMKDLEEGYETLCQAFPDVAIGKVHGRMKSVEKEEQMRRFVEGETRILVATTVIEVGVNVPNASLMVIENAERFGLAQLHQLRGRVGRGAEQSYCVLVTGPELTKDMQRRIEIMTGTTDGFLIAEEDMKLRGPGDLGGTRQSGFAFDLRLANLGRDGAIVQCAREAALRLLDEDPLYDRPENAPVWEHLRELRGSDIDWSSIS